MRVRATALPARWRKDPLRRQATAYRGAADLIGRIQSIYAKAGLVRPRRIAFLAGNCGYCWCASVAAHLSGFSITWLHPAGSLDDQIYQIEDAEIDALVVDAEHFATRGDQLAARIPRDMKLFRIGHASFGADLLSGAEAAGSFTPRDLAKTTDIALLNYTGGTTGRPKGAMRRHGAVTSYVTAILANFELPVSPRYLTVAPISHVAGVKVLPTLILGGTVHLLTGFDPSRVLRTISEHKINFSLMVPTMIYALLDHPEFAKADLSSLELLLYGAAAMSPSRLEDGLKRIGPVFSQLYGQTECYPATVLRRSDHDLSRKHLFTSCGLPVTAADVRLIDDEGSEVPLGDAGEICIRSPYVMEEYWKLSDLTHETLKHGWLHTGDIGRRDDEGFLYIVDRKKEMVITGGFNVFPREVEDSLTSHPAVANAAVIGVPDEKWGEAVTAIVVLRSPHGASEQELVLHVKDKKGAVQAPKSIYFVDDLPMTPLGKVDKQALRARYCTKT
ncbi:AMP-binding protein [Bradyrhizobium algeriense]|uniref:AMP-binding protein n=1 Tax=Bradyrhizobium algeriense TaxID=634784 RepID=UPI002FEF286D